MLQALIGAVLVLLAVGALWRQALLFDESPRWMSSANDQCALQLPGEPWVTGLKSLTAACAAIKAQQVHGRCGWIDKDTQKRCQAHAPAILASRTILFPSAATEGTPTERLPRMAASNWWGMSDILVANPLFCEGAPIATGVATWHLVDPGGYGSCSAVAVSARHLLTAAHCLPVPSTPGASIKVYVPQGPGKWEEVSCTPHPSYQGIGDQPCATSDLDCTRDIAVCDVSRLSVALHETVSVNRAISDALLASTPRDIYVVGYGRGSKACWGDSTLSRLSEPAGCDRLASGTSPGDIRSICLSGAGKPPVDPLHRPATVEPGDSGGPVFDQTVAGRRSVIGIVKSADPGVPSVDFVQLSDPAICAFLIANGVLPTCP